MDKETFEEQAARRLDEHADAIDGPTLSKLHQARNHALARRGRRRAWQAATWTGAGGLAAGVLVAVMIAPQSPPPLPDIYADPVQQAAAMDMELMDDLEFMAWLVLEDELAGDVAEPT